ncbi:MAG: glycosyltransferase family 4 protein [Gemmatimonadales bacterium]|nr:MAG: glycosyltransferase family 4 protein [Gemmatimonadales bacterium]
MKVALVHEWVAQWGGSESVLRELADLFPSAPIYLGAWIPDATGRSAFPGSRVRTSSLQRLLPLVGGNHRRLLPFMPGAFRALELEGYDLVISSSHAFAKAVRPSGSAAHLCYCHTPPRYLWDLWDTYSPGWRGWMGRPLRTLLRRADLRAAGGVDRFIANSRTVADRIERHYRRSAEVLHPPVHTRRFEAAARLRRAKGRGPEPWFLAGGRLVAYKRTELLVRAATRARMPLKVFGEGPEWARVQAAAGPTVAFLGRVSDDELPHLMAACQAYLFGAEEDFGILPVEAQAAGRPVVAYGKGGATETVRDGETGILVAEATEEAFAQALVDVRSRSWDPARIQAHARRFDAERFRTGMRMLAERAVGGGGAHPGGLP